jgi:hypothetical protein
MISEPHSPGEFQFKIVILDKNRQIAASPVANLTVQRSSHPAKQGSPSPRWGVLDAASDGAAGAVVAWILCLFICFD